MGKTIDEVEFKDAVIAIPKNTVKLEIIATIYEDGELHEVGGTYDMQEVQHLFQLFWDTIEGDYPKFELTDKGKAYLALKELNKSTSEDN